MQKNITSEYIVKRDQLDHIAKAVKRKRTNKKMTQIQLAKSARISPQYISNIETFRANAVNIDTLSKIAKALKAERRDLIGRPPRHQEHDHGTQGQCDPDLIPLDDSFYELYAKTQSRNNAKWILFQNVLVVVFLIAIIILAISLWI